jgi:hypothetical protein
MKKIPMPAWLLPGNDHELARTKYASRESASDEKARKDAERNRLKPEKRATAIRKGQQWANGGYCPAGYAHTGRCPNRH